jgi:hypothetical protein
LLAGDSLGKIEKDTEEEEDTDLINYDDVNDASDDWHSVEFFIAPFCSFLRIGFLLFLLAFI